MTGRQGAWRSLIGAWRSLGEPRDDRTGARDDRTGARGDGFSRSASASHPRRRAGPGAAALEDIRNPTGWPGSLAAPPAYDDCDAGALRDNPSPRANRGIGGDHMSTNRVTTHRIGTPRVCTDASRRRGGCGERERARRPSRVARQASPIAAASAGCPRATPRRDPQAGVCALRARRRIRPAAQQPRPSQHTDAPGRLPGTEPARARCVSPSRAYGTRARRCRRSASATSRS